MLNVYNKFDKPHELNGYDEKYPLANAMQNLNKHLDKLSTTDKDILKSNLDVIKKHPSTQLITDATAGIGGNVINFSKHFAHVNSIEINNIHYEVIKNNYQPQPTLVFHLGSTEPSKTCLFATLQHSM